MGECWELSICTSLPPHTEDQFCLQPQVQTEPGGLRSAFTCWPNFTFEGCLLSVILEVNFQPHTMMGRILFPRGGVKGDEKKRCIHEEESL